MWNHFIYWLIDWIGSPAKKMNSTLHLILWFFFQLPSHWNVTNTVVRTTTAAAAATAGITTTATSMATDPLHLRRVRVPALQAKASSGLCQRRHRRQRRQRHSYKNKRRLSKNCLNNIQLLIIFNCNISKCKFCKAINIL